MKLDYLHWYLIFIVIVLIGLLWVIATKEDK